MLNLPLPTRQLSRPNVGALVSAFESETQAVIIRTSPRNDNTIFYALIAMLIVAMIFVGFFKLDIVVSGTGLTVAQDGSLYVTPLEKGIVRQILVKNGDLVKKGQVLATLDPTFTAADVSKYQQTVDTTQEEVNRLEAEQKGFPYAPAGNTPYQKLQLAQYQQRQATFKANVANFDAQIAQYQATLKQYSDEVVTYSQRLKTNVSLEDMQQKLEAQGWGSRLKTLSANDARLEIQRLLDFSASQIPVIKGQIAQYQAQRQAYITQWNSDIAGWLSNDRTTIEQAQQNLAQAAAYNQYATLTAPVDAYVLKIGKASVGATVGGGTPDEGPDPMFTLVPMIHPLLVEDDISTQDIGFVNVGDKVTIKLDAYLFVYYGTVEGVVKSISQNSFTTDINNNPVAPYYKVLVEITKLDLKHVPHPLLIPGMTLEGDVLAGRRTILDYILQAARVATADAMREP